MTKSEQARDEILKETMEELSALRQTLPDQTQTAGAIETIDFYETMLRECTGLAQVIEWCGRAVTDVTHEVAAAKYGWDTPKADAVFYQQEHEFNELLFRLRQAVAASKMKSDLRSEIN